MKLIAALIGSELEGSALVVKEIGIANRSDGLPDPTFLNPVRGDGSVNNPFDASSPAKCDFILNLLRNLAPSPPLRPYMTIHLGPGCFRTHGGRRQLAWRAWRPTSGQRIVGAGRG